MKKLTTLTIILAVHLLTLSLALALQTAGVTAEPLSIANLRPDPSLNGEPLTSIQSGAQYPVIGRSEFYPWVLLGDPQTAAPIGWVYVDLVTITGDVNQVPFSTVVVSSGSSTAPTPPPSSGDSSADSSASPLPTPTEFELVGVAAGALATSTPPAPAGIVGRATGEINIRFGPGIDYPRIGVARADDRFEVTAYHTQVPWVQIRYDDVAGGFGWVAIDLLEINGNIYTLPSVSRLNFDLPTLTPTPDAVGVVSGLPGFAPPAPSAAFKALGDTLWAKVLDAGFEPETSRLGSLFLMNLQTGEAITFGDNIAYSGMSLSKIGILLTMYRYLDRLPDGEEARHLASMMICSENTSSNQILTYIGGDPYSGAAQVTATLRELGLQETYMVAPFLIDPRITPQPVSAPQSPADQTRTNPDPFNQMTVGELGWMLASMYQCAADGSGALIDTFGDAFDQRECQQMLYLMSGNKIGALIEVGVPENIPVAHKHGWIDDTHGDAGIVFTPGGNYVFVAVLHSPTWLNFEESFPLLEDLSLTVYNHFNPDTPLADTRESIVPETCDLSNTEGAAVMDNLTRGRAGELFP